MHRKLLLFLVQITIFCNQYKFTDAKAFIGSNSRAVNEQEYPSVVCIMHSCQENGQRRERVVCTGTLITINHILTAAHCFKRLTLTNSVILYSSVDIRHGRRLYPMWWITFEQWATRNCIAIIHPSNDISVLRVISSVSEAYITTALSPVASNRLYGLETVSVGCGQSEPPDFPTNIEIANLTIISNSECERRANDIQGYYVPVHEKDLCSVGNPFTLFSPGDSGGPLLYGDFILAVNRGVYPRVQGNYHENQVNYHVGIDFYRHFIDSATSM